MPVLGRRTVRIGDVFQILTSEGVCYGLVTHSHEKWGFVISVFRDFYDQEPEDFASVVAGSPQITTTFLIQHAVRSGLFALVAHVEVPDHLQDFPTFRGTNNLKGDDTLWFFWNGKEEWRVQRPLSEAEKRYPEGPSLPSAPLLIEMIQKNYRAELDYI
ncbi:hypothetical protein [Thioclava sp. GXIMD2076]|uniref:hypothetical protein n=1 Tax=Thioclava sp. GXIMD2076 TaxID=3131931 RepID=UPI0030D3B96F